MGLWKKNNLGQVEKIGVKFHSAIVWSTIFRVLYRCNDTVTSYTSFEKKPSSFYKTTVSSEVLVKNCCLMTANVILAALDVE